MLSLRPMLQGANQEWADVIVDNEDRYEERIAGTLTDMSQREVVIQSRRERTEGLDLLWLAAPRAGEEPRNPQDVLIETDLLPQRMKKRRGTAARIRNNPVMCLNPNRLSLIALVRTETEPDSG